MIYTTGYYGHQPEALKSLAAALRQARRIRLLFIAQQTYSVFLI